MSYPLQATVYSIESLLSSGTFRPAIVQRALVWDERMALRLLADIATAAGFASELGTQDDELEEDQVAERFGTGQGAVESYVIGTVQLRAERPGHYDIYDGLQRLTTLTLILSILRDLQQGTPVAVVQGLVMTGEGPRLTLVSGNETLLEYVQRPGSTTAERTLEQKGASSRRVYALRGALLEELSSWSAEALAGLTTYLCRSVLVVAMFVDTEALGRQVFVTTNARGTSLVPTELLKGELLRMAPDRSKDVAARWDEIRELAPDLEEFLRCVDAIERTTPQRPSWPLDLGAHLALKHRTADAIYDWLGKVRGWAKSWASLQQVLRRGGRDELEHHVWRLSAFRWFEWKPLALYWWSELFGARHRDRRLESLASRVLEALHKRCMAFTLIRTPLDVERAFMNALAQSQGTENRNPTNNKGHLRATPNQLVKVRRTLLGQIRTMDEWVPLMKWFESLEWGEGKPTQLRRSTVEHIAPRRPKQAVTRAPGFDVAAYDDLCFSLGNLALAPRQVNEDLGNREWSHKRDILRAYADRYRTLADAVQHEVWDESTVRTRRDRLYTELVEAMGLSQRQGMAL